MLRVRNDRLRDETYHSGDGFCGIRAGHYGFLTAVRVVRCGSGQVEIGQSRKEADVGCCRQECVTWVSKILNKL